MSSPTLVLLLKAPRACEVKTRLAATVGPAHAVQIYRQMVEKQIQAIPFGWTTRIHCAPAEQIKSMQDWLSPFTCSQASFHGQPDGDLGERIQAALAEAFLQDSDPVIVIGGDCPALDESLLRRAACALEEHDAVLGPAHDGGYYLLGLRAPQPHLFTNMPWSTPTVLSETRYRLRKSQLSTKLLPMLMDVDNADDWREAVANGWLSA